jgi:branched-chain amino acid transport system permease protein
VVLAVSLNLVVGISGELSLGHAGFMGVGAFTGIVVAACLKEVIPNDFLRLVVSMFAGGLLFTAMAWWRHKANIIRLKNGTENRFERKKKNKQE